MVNIAKPLAEVNAGDILKAQKMNEIIERIDNLEKRLDQMEGKNPKRKTTKKKSPKTAPLYHIDSVK